MKHGKWIDCSNGWMCSSCGKDSIREYTYCPHCGAKMDLKEKTEAIPIEWIKEWEQKDENFFLYMGLTKKLIEDWEKENE